MQVYLKRKNVPYFKCFNENLILEHSYGPLLIEVEKEDFENIYTYGPYDFLLIYDI